MSLCGQHLPWLRLAKNISQVGQPMVLFGAGVGVPANLEECVERRYFAVIHYLALVCDDAVLEQRQPGRNRRSRRRLDWRPAWV
jgi:hypothetical protein